MIVSLIILYIPLGSFHVYKILSKEFVPIDFIVVVLLRILNFVKDAM